MQKVPLAEHPKVVEAQGDFRTTMPLEIATEGCPT